MYCFGHDGVKANDWWAKQPSQAACASENLKCWGAWDTKLKTWHYWQLGGERSRKRKCLLIFHERMRKGHRQSDKHWNTFRQHWVKTSDWWGGSHMGLPKPRDTTLNSTELNRSHITGCSVCLSKSFDNGSNILRQQAAITFSRNHRMRNCSKVMTTASDLPDEWSETWCRLPIQHMVCLLSNV